MKHKDRGTPRGSGTRSPVRGKGRGATNSNAVAGRVALANADSNEPLARLPRRDRSAHKGDFGRVLVIAGSVSMPGAALLATLGALRGGAGLVTLATVKEIVPWLASAAPSAMFLAVSQTRRGGIGKAALETLREHAESADVLAIGPGLGRDPETAGVVRALLSTTSKAVVLDADGLNAYEHDASALANRRAPLVITPHPGEFARLVGTKAPVSEAGRRERAEALARRLACVVLLKGNRTIVTDGARTRMNETGNPGMATGGSGDVLTGVIGALLAVLPAFDAAALGAHVHGLAGDLAAGEGSETSLIATDLLAALPRAFRTLEER